MADGYGASVSHLDAMTRLKHCGFSESGPNEHWAIHWATDDWMPSFLGHCITTKEAWEGFRAWLLDVSRLLASYEDAAVLCNRFRQELALAIDLDLPSLAMSLLRSQEVVIKALADSGQLLPVGEVCEYYEKHQASPKPKLPPEGSQDASSLIL